MKISPNSRPFRFSLGERGEIAARDFLSKQGYDILEKNYRCALGEIDVIARRDGRIFFVEIKTRSGDQFGQPQEAVGAPKQAKLLKLAAWYLKSKKLTDVPVSFAVVAVLWPEGRSPEIRLIEDAFEEKDF